MGVTVQALHRYDWDFATAATAYLTHRIHPYPAKFIPQIPNLLIRELSEPGEVVADIFAGSGTTLVEGLVLGRHVKGVDANPLACLISTAKTTRLEAGDEQSLRRLADKAEDLAGAISMRGQGLFSDAEPFRSSAWRPDDDAISFWFEPFVVEELAEALAWCRALDTDSSRRVALAAFSSIVVAVSKQDSDTRYVRRDKGIRPGEPLRRFARAVSDAVDAALEFTNAVPPGLRREVYHADLLDKPDIGSVDLVVCSPPYPNAYSYHLYHRTRMLWLGMDPLTFKKQEIGSHRKYSRKAPIEEKVATFRKELGQIFDWLGLHLRRHRFACFVIGNSTINGVEVRNADLIKEAGEERGFVEVARLTRRLNAKKKSFNPAIGKIKAEDIVVLQNLGGTSL